MSEEQEASELIERISLRLGWKVDEVPIPGQYESCEGETWPSTREVITNPRGEVVENLPETIEDLMEYQEDFKV